MDEQPNADWSDDRIVAWARAHAPAWSQLDEEDRWSARHDLVELLIEEGFVRGRRPLRELYTELFPPAEEQPDLREEFPDLGPMLLALAAGAPSERERGARYLQKLATQEVGMASTLALGDPRTIDRLLSAAADGVPAVQEAALDALGLVVERAKFYAPEVFDRVLGVHDGSAAAGVRRAAALVLAEFEDPRRWRPLAGALAEKGLPELARSKLARAVRLGPRNTPAEDARLVAERLLELFAGEKKRELKTALLKSLGTIGARDAAARVRELGVKGINPDVVNEAMQRMEARTAPGQPP
jgi:hypothetical protein